MTAYIHDGFEFDLTRSYMDVVGIDWSWTGEWNAAGEPLMLGHGDSVPVPLPDVYRDHGPLIPIAAPVTAALMRDVFTGTVIA